MLKNIYLYTFILFAFLNPLNASSVSTEKLQILASKLETKDNIITASGNVLVHSATYYITAQKVIYDKEKSVLVLFDDVNIIKNGTTTTFSDYAFLDFSNEVNKFTPILLIDNSNNIWINSKEAKESNSTLELKSSTLSSCDCDDPAWSIGFTSGDYNREEQWINTYNTTLYINKMPVFYTPYFGFPTDKTRRTGLLRPTFGYSNKEGFLYAQPIFYAPSLSWDMEYIPQIRLNRGSGHQLKYRLKDSVFSSFEIEAGIFTENSSYFNKSNLLNKIHKGYDLKYERSNVISKSDEQDGLLISLHGLNDIDYINTQYNNDNISTNKLIQSNMKYFYNTNKIYGDIDLKYYDDTSKTNNDNTMHELPKINLHKYTSQTNIDNLLYSADIKFTNKTRKVGLDAQIVELNIPLTYSFKLFDDYINVMFSEEINFVDIKYDNNVNNHKDGEFIENKHIVKLSTDLLKPYKDYIHTINFDLTLTTPNIIKQDGDLYSITNNTDELKVIPVSKTKKNMSFSLNQSIYNKITLEQIINHKMNQSIIYNDNGSTKLSDLENELILYYRYGLLSNRFLYNHQDNMFIDSTTTVTFDKNDFSSRIYYSFSKDTSSIASDVETYSYKNLPDSKSITLDMSYEFNKYYTLTYKEEYDLVTKISKSIEYSLNIDKKCWAIDIRLANNLVASTTTNNTAIRQNIAYVQVTLKPISTINQEYIYKKREE